MMWMWWRTVIFLTKLDVLPYWQKIQHCTICWVVCFSLMHGDRVVDAMIKMLLIIRWQELLSPRRRLPRHHRLALLHHHHLVPLVPPPPPPKSLMPCYPAVLLSHPLLVESCQVCEHKLTHIYTITIRSNPLYYTTYWHTPAYILLPPLIYPHHVLLPRNLSSSPTYSPTDPYLTRHCGQWPDADDLWEHGHCNSKHRIRSNIGSSKHQFFPGM